AAPPERGCGHGRVGAPRWSATTRGTGRGARVKGDDTRARTSVARSRHMVERSFDPIPCKRRFRVGRRVLQPGARLDDVSGWDGCAVEAKPERGTSGSSSSRAVTVPAAVMAT